MPKKRRQRLSESTAVAAVALKRRLQVPMGLDPEVARGVETVIKPADFKLINIDERYQRARIDTEVNELIHVLRAGKGVPARVHLAKRAFVEPGVNPEALWVVDGQQRWWAHYETDVPMYATIHTVRSIEEEKKLFLILNSRVQVGANFMVHSWPGPSADLLRLANEQHSHPLFNRVQLAASGGDRIAAGVLIKGLDALLTGTGRSEAIRKHLARADAHLLQPGMKDRSIAFLHLVGQVFPKGYVYILPMLALGLVARKRWEGLITPAGPGVVKLLQRTNWATEVPSYSMKFLPVVVASVERKWK